MLPISEFFSVAINEKDTYAKQDDRQQMRERKILEDRLLGITEEALFVIFVNKAVHNTLHSVANGGRTNYK